LAPALAEDAVCLLQSGLRSAGGVALIEPERTERPDLIRKENRVEPVAAVGLDSSPAHSELLPHLDLLDLLPAPAYAGGWLANSTRTASPSPMSGMDHMKHMQMLAQKLGVDRRTAGWTLSIGMGLLASSCCLLQLIVWALATMGLLGNVAGCMGFKKVLGPAQLYIRLLTLTGLGLAWAGVGNMTVECLRRQTAVCLLLMFLPEVVRFLGGPSFLPRPAPGKEVVQLTVDGMGCDACAFAVKSALLSVPGVCAASVDAETGVAEVHVEKIFDRDIAALKLDVAGFDLVADVAAAAGGYLGTGAFSLRTGAQEKDEAAAAGAAEAKEQAATSCEAEAATSCEAEAMCSEAAS